MSNARTTATWTPGGGLQQVPVRTSSASAPTSGAPILLGLDFADFNFASPGSLTIGFANLIARAKANPLATLTADGGQLIVPPGATLLLMVATELLAGPSGAIVGARGQGVTNTGVRAPGPFFGPGAYSAFSAIIQAAGAGTVQGQVAALLILQVS